MKRKKVGIALAVIMVVIGLSVAGYMVLSKKKNDKPVETATTQSDAFVLDTFSIDQLEEKYGKDPMSLRSRLLDEASRLEYSGKTTESLEYYRRVNKIEGVDQSQRDFTNYTAYKIALSTNDKALEDEFLGYLGGEEKLNQMDSSIIKISEE